MSFEMTTPAVDIRVVSIGQSLQRVPICQVTLRGHQNGPLPISLQISSGSVVVSLGPASNCLQALPANVQPALLAGSPLERVPEVPQPNTSSGPANVQNSTQAMPVEASVNFPPSDPCLLEDHGASRAAPDSDLRRLRPDDESDSESFCNRQEGFLTEPLRTDCFASEYLRICREVSPEAPRFQRDVQALKKLVDVLFLGTEDDVTSFRFLQEHLNPALMLINARRCKQAELR